MQQSESKEIRTSNYSLHFILYNYQAFEISSKFLRAYNHGMICKTPGLIL